MMEVKVIDDLNKNELDEIMCLNKELFLETRTLIDSSLSGPMDIKLVNSKLKEIRKRGNLIDKRLRAIGIK